MDEAKEERGVGSPESIDGRNEDENQRMQREIADLRAELARRDAEAGEAALLEELYPGIRKEDIPTSVFEEAQARAIPLAAAFAIHDRRCAAARARAESVNEQNRCRSAGRVGQSASSTCHFTLEEIRAMTPAQVKRNYKQIIKSLTKQNQ